MNPQMLTNILLVVAVAVIAYLLGERRAMRRDAVDAAAARERPSPNPVILGEDAPPTSGPPSGGPGQSSAKPPTLAPPFDVMPIPRPADAPRLDVAKLEYEEDAEVDPTTVGAAASAPASKRTIYSPPVTKIIHDAGADLAEAEQAESFFFVSATAQTDKGLRRKRNEDSVGVLESNNVFIVADGMGGYAGGELASRLAVDTIIGAFKSGSFEGPPDDELPPEANELARAMQMANAAIGEEAAKNKKLEGMGTTVVAAAFSPKKGRLYVGHVGDSRCYRLRDGDFCQLTADHTMSEFGVTGPEGYQLSRAVGIWPTVPIDMVMAIPKAGDVYLLCSDGLTKMLHADVIKNVLDHEEHPKAAVERLILFANAHGGKDNITIILVRVVPPNWRPKPSEPFPKASVRPPPMEEEAPPSKGPPAGARYLQKKK